MNDVSQDFRRAVLVTSSYDSSNLSFKDIDYYWRIAGIYDSGTETDFSSPDQFKIDKTPPSHCTYISPEANLVCDGTNYYQNSTPKFSWNKADGATKYRFRLEKDNEKVIEVTTSNTYYTLT